MSIFEITGDGAVKLEPAGPSAYGPAERADLQRLLRSQIDIVAPDVLVVGEDVGGDDEPARRGGLGPAGRGRQSEAEQERPEPERAKSKAVHRFHGYSPVEKET